MESTLINVLVPALISFVIGIGITPLVTHFLFKFKVWKKPVAKLLWAVTRLLNSIA